MISQPRIAVITKNRTNPAYEGARLGADRVAASVGARTQHYVPMIPDDVEEQRLLLRDAIDSRPEGIVLAPTHVHQLDDLVEEIGALGIPLAFIVGRTFAGTPISFVHSDDYALAREVALYLFRHLDFQGQIMIMEGHPNAETGVDRVRAFRDAASEVAGISVAVNCKGEYQREPAKKSALAAMSDSTTRLDGVLCANDLMAMGVIDAMHAVGKFPPIVAANASPDGIDAIKKGTMLASASFNAMAMACLATEALIRHLRGESVPNEIVLPVEVVDRSNLASWDLPYEERPLPIWEEIISTTTQRRRT